MILIAIIICIIISTGSFAWGYWLAGYEEVVRWFLALGIVWLASIRFKWRWFSAPAVLISLLLAVYGVWFEFLSRWMFSGVVFALFAWDLAEFQVRLRILPARENHPAMIRRHILRISLLVMMGLVFISLFILARGQFTRDWGFFVLGVTLLGSLQIFAWRRR